MTLLTSAQLLSNDGRPDVISTTWYSASSALHITDSGMPAWTESSRGNLLATTRGTIAIRAERGRIRGRGARVPRRELRHSPQVVGETCCARAQHQPSDDVRGMMPIV